MSDLHPFRDLYDAAIRHSGTRLTCPRCERVAVLPTAGLWRLFNRNGWNDRFEHVKRRLLCQSCWRRHQVKIRPNMSFCDDPPTDAKLPMPAKDEWNREARRRR